MEQERLHREMLRDHLREEKLNSLKLKVKRKEKGSFPPYTHTHTYGAKTLTVGLAVNILGKVASSLLRWLQFSCFQQAGIDPVSHINSSGFNRLHLGSLR